MSRLENNPRVYTDQAPFDELMEAIQIPGLGKPLSMLA